MRKNEKTNRNNIVPFPNLEQRLLDKGMQALKDREFKEALQFFNQLTNQSQQYPEVEIGIVVCLLELGLYEDAKAKCERLLNEDIGDYFNVLQIYINILIQLAEYETVVHTLEVIFEEERVPTEQAETLFHLLEFSRRKLENDEHQEIVELSDIKLLEPQLLYGEIDQQLLAIHKLREYTNIELVIDSIKGILKDSAYHPIVQSMLLQLLMEKKVNEIITVKKLKRSIKVNPCEINSSFEQPFTQEVLNRLDDVLGQENPTLFESVKQLWEQYLFAIFPFDPAPKNSSVWAAALHRTGYELYGIDILIEELAESYDVEEKLLLKASISLIELEKVSNLGINL
ncbi:tetratricopeptide repeat protein [Bacillus sp. Marseille-P3661]|uniref:tetratricopeptide repeat protein n=1 Tax=Bacillus sp. Marseille-P3661 TaxID=1936234 RepID=UPI000C85B37F|nr:tetratricopeptide repeat protein [Bacillus sp. Marseille-P3661]